MVIVRYTQFTNYIKHRRLSELLDPDCQCVGIVQYVHEPTRSLYLRCSCMREMLQPELILLGFARNRKIASSRFRARSLFASRSSSACTCPPACLHSRQVCACAVCSCAVPNSTCLDELALRPGAQALVQRPSHACCSLLCEAMRHTCTERALFVIIQASELVFLLLLLLKRQRLFPQFEVN